MLMQGAGVSCLSGPSYLSCLCCSVLPVLSVCVCLCVCLLARSFVLFVCLFVCLFVWLFVCLFVCLFVLFCLFVYVFICLFVCACRVSAYPDPAMMQGTEGKAVYALPYSSREAIGSLSVCVCARVCRNRAEAFCRQSSVTR